MQLIYRAQTLRYVARSAQFTCQPHAVNWRYQVSEQPISNLSIPALLSHEPRAINWRFCV